MKKSKNSIIITVVVFLSIIYFTAQKAVCSGEDTITWMDNQPYWFQLAEGNTWTWKQTTPGSDKSEIYTKKITGTVKVRGLDAVKLEVVDSEIAYGADSKGSYTAFLPDTSSNQTMVKMHIARDPIFGTYDLLFMPFTSMPRYAKQPAQPLTAAGRCFPIRLSPQSIKSGQEYSRICRLIPAIRYSARRFLGMRMLPCLREHLRIVENMKKQCPSALHSTRRQT